MALKDLTGEQRELAVLLSRISERRYRATWMSGIELEVWQDLIAPESPKLRAGLTPEEADQLKELSARCDGWIVFDRCTEETFVGMAEWLDRYVR